MIFSGIKMEKEIVYKYDTHGSYGQHYMVAKFIVDLNTLTQTPLWKIDGVHWENNDSNKNKHREATIDKETLIKLLEGNKLLKVVTDKQSSSKREIYTEYYFVNNGQLFAVNSENQKINGKYYDVMEINGLKIYVNKDEVKIDDTNVEQGRKIEKRWL